MKPSKFHGGADCLHPAQAEESVRALNRSRGKGQQKVTMLAKATE